MRTAGCLQWTVLIHLWDNNGYNGDLTGLKDKTEFNYLGDNWDIIGLKDQTEQNILEIN